MSLLDIVWSPATLYLTTADSAELSGLVGTTGRGLLSVTVTRNDEEKKKRVRIKLDKN